MASSNPSPQPFILLLASSVEECLEPVFLPRFQRWVQPLDYGLVNSDTLKAKLELQICFFHRFLRFYFVCHSTFGFCFFF
jgi:hypothetical protein